VNAATNTVSATINTVAQGPLVPAVTPDGKTLYVSNEFTNNVTVIATANNTITKTIATGLIPIGVAITPSGATAYVSNGANNNISVIPTATNTVSATIAGAPSSGPEGMAVTRDGTTLFVANFTNDTVSVISTATNTVNATIPVGQGPCFIALRP
jgi:YVTN family beta-propeller protein